MNHFKDQFMQAARLLQAGRPADALPLVERLLEAQAKHPEVLHLAGVIRLALGDLEAGEALLGKAVAAAPNNPEIPYNHASALLKAGHDEKAVRLFDRCLEINARHVSAWQNRGTALVNLGRTEEAAESYRRVLALEPAHAGALCNLGNLALADDRAEEARDLFQRALAVRRDHAAAWRGLCAALQLTGSPREAVEAGEQATRLAPDDPASWTELGRARTRANAFEAAVEAHRRAVELSPDDADAWNNLGAANTALSRFDAAEEAFEKALALDPEHTNAVVNHAALLELANRPDEALALIDGAEPNPRLELTAAKCIRRCGDIESARGRFEKLLSTEPPLAEDIRKDAHFALGQICDRANENDLAFEHYRSGNRLALSLWGGAGEHDTFLPGLAGIREVFSGEASWAMRSGPEQADSPAFLFGFQRSGTTLLDTVLGAHPQVRVMEELPVLNRVIAEMDRRFGPYPAHLPRLSDADLDELRAQYREVAFELSGHRLESGVLLLDKSPLHTVHAGFLRMLFPQAPIIFALRHPLDVCLSCFMQDFTLSAFMTHFLSVEGAARVYRDVMTLWLQYQSVMDLPCHEFRYEELVESPESVLRAATGYLGLEWTDDLLRHEDHARRRGLINTPSYEQVTQPIYKSAVGRWKKYRHQLEEAEQLVAPFIDAFGYDR